MNISGLESNYYLIDNPVYITIGGILSDSIFVELSLSLYDSNGVIISNSTPQKLYNLSSSVILDISSLLKSYMPEPSHNTDYTNLTDFAFYGNHIKARLTVKEYKYTYFLDNSEGGIGTLRRELIVRETKQETKYFIRGGKRGYEANQKLTAGQKLILTDKIPVWGGYPSDYYYIDATTGMKKSNTIPGSLKEERPVKGCNPYYIKFINSLGGYSYWLFENWEQEESSENLGDILRQNSVLDLGNEHSEELTIISKVPNRFIALIKDLIISKEIYLYDQALQTWTRISSDKNKVIENPYDVNTKVKLKFKPYSRYNPSLLW